MSFAGKIGVRGKGPCFPKKAGNFGFMCHVIGWLRGVVTNEKGTFRFRRLVRDLIKRRTGLSRWEGETILEFYKSSSL